MTAAPRGCQVGSVHTVHRATQTARASKGQHEAWLPPGGHSPILGPTLCGGPSPCPWGRQGTTVTTVRRRDVRVVGVGAERNGGVWWEQRLRAKERTPTTCLGKDPNNVSGIQRALSARLANTPLVKIDQRCQSGTHRLGTVGVAAAGLFCRRAGTAPQRGAHRERGHTRHQEATRGHNEGRREERGSMVRSNPPPLPL